MDTLIDMSPGDYMNMEENNYRIPRMENYRMRKSDDARFMVQITMILVVLHAMTLFW